MEHLKPRKAKIVQLEFKTESYHHREKSCRFDLLCQNWILDGLKVLISIKLL